jgi:hypothetical protein
MSCDCMYTHLMHQPAGVQQVACTRSTCPNCLAHMPASRRDTPLLRKQRCALDCEGWASKMTSSWVEVPAWRWQGNIAYHAMPPETFVCIMLHEYSVTQVSTEHAVYSQLQDVPAVHTAGTKHSTRLNNWKGMEFNKKLLRDVLKAGAPHPTLWSAWRTAPRVPLTCQGMARRRAAASSNRREVLDRMPYQANLSGFLQIATDRTQEESSLRRPRCPATFHIPRLVHSGQRPDCPSCLS